MMILTSLVIMTFQLITIDEALLAHFTKVFFDPEVFIHVLIEKTFIRVGIVTSRAVVYFTTVTFDMLL